MAKQKTRINKTKNLAENKQEKSILASASFSQTPDINILEEDLYREYQKDDSRTDIGLLVDNKWIRFFDANSSFLNRLVALVANSPTIRNIVNQKTSLTLGSGFVPISADRVPFLQTLRKLFKLQTADEKAEEFINDLIGNVNLNNETLEEVIEKVAFDYYAFGNAIVQLKKAKRNGKEIVYIYHLPLDQVGIKEANANNIVESIGITSNWQIDGNSPSSITEIPMYPEFSEDGSSAIHIKKYAPGFFYWGLPNWISAQSWTEIEYRIPKYNIGKFKNGFKPSALIQAYGNFTPEEAQLLVDSFEEGYTDTGENSNLIVQVLRKKEDAADITLFEDKSEGNYIELQRLASQAIITAEGWTTSLAGIATSGKLGANQQMRDELEFVTNMEIKKVMRKIMQSIVNPFIKENQEVNPDLKGVMLHIANMNPISLASMLDPNTILTKDEMREIYGYEGLGEETAAPEDSGTAKKDNSSPQENK